MAYFDVGSFQQTEMKPTACRIQDEALMFLVVGSAMATFQEVLTDSRVPF